MFLVWSSAAGAAAGVLSDFCEPVCALPGCAANRNARNSIASNTRFPDFIWFQPFDLWAPRHCQISFPQFKSARRFRRGLTSHERQGPLTVKTDSEPKEPN